MSVQRTPGRLVVLTCIPWSSMYVCVCVCLCMPTLQADVETVAQEEAAQAVAKPPVWRMPYTPSWTPEEKLKSTDKVRHTAACLPSYAALPHDVQ